MEANFIKTLKLYSYDDQKQLFDIKEKYKECDTYSYEFTSEFIKIVKHLQSNNIDFDVDHPMQKIQIS
jgi:hypothetical protein